MRREVALFALIGIALALAGSAVYGQAAPGETCAAEGQTETCTTFDGKTGTTTCRVVRGDLSQWGPCIAAPATCTSPQVFCAGACVTPRCTSDAQCGSGQSCINPGTCIASCSNDPGSGERCASDIDCSAGEFCSSGACVAKSFENATSRIWSTGALADAIGTGAVADGGAEASESVSVPTRPRIPLLSACTQNVYLHRYSSDDAGRIEVNGKLIHSDSCSGSVCNVDESFQDANGNYRTPNGVSSADLLPIFTRDSATVTGFVRDVNPAPAGVTTRVIFAEFNFTVLVPNDGQVCKNGRIEPNCAGTKESCGFASCSVCEDGFVPVGTQTVCEGNNLVTRQTEQFSTGVCSGVYGSCQPVPTGETRTTVIATQFCRYGCSASACNANRPPVLSSLSSATGFVRPGSNITINATASDPDTVFNPAAPEQSSREKITLRCSSVGAGSGDGGGDFSEEEFPSTGAFITGLATASGDQLDPNSVTYLHADISDWSVTSQVTSVVQEPGLICVRHTKAGQWPVTGPGTEGNPWVFANIGGRWYGGTYEHLRPGQECKALDTNPPAITITDSIGAGVKAEPLKSWKPKVGETVGLAMATRSRDSFRSPVNERSNIVLVTWQVAAGTGGGDGGVLFNPDVCKEDKFSLQNPSCTFPSQSLGNKSGSVTVFCRAFDGQLYSEEKSITFSIDTQKPVSTILSPEPGSVQQKSFAVSVFDNDTGSGLAQCEYRVLDSGAVSRDWTNRTCNAAFAVSLPADCKTLGAGACRVEARARDIAGNTGDASGRAFGIAYLSSNITSPPDGSIQRSNFTVTVRDEDFSGARLEKCEFAITTSSSAELAWQNRTCNSAFAVSVGPSGNCSAQGNATCFVAARATNNNSVTGAPSTRIYSIDFMTPFTEILSPDEGTWHSDDFDATIRDTDPGGFGLARCEYRVESRSVEILPWSQRQCSAPVKVRVGVDCLDEGGDACRLFARAISASGAAGVEANRTFGILLDKSVTLDGFLSVDAAQTDTGLNFSGVPRPAFSFPPNFIACSSGASPSACRDAFSVTGETCGLGQPCLCGSALENRCHLGCNDRNVTYYLLASGLSGVTRVTAVSNVFAASCPSFSIEALLADLDFFRSLERDLSILIMQTDFIIRNTNDTAQIEVLKQRSARYEEARDLAVGHINLLEESLPKLSVTLSQQMLAEGEAVRKRIAEILTAGGFVPTLLDFSLNTLDPYRLNASASVEVALEKAGTLDIFASLSCTVTSPNGSATRRDFGCFAAEDKALAVDFAADKAGSWSVACELNRSVRSDCSLSRRVKSETAFFNVLPGFDAFIDDVVPPLKAVNGTNATARVSVRNPDLAERRALVQCSFVRPDNSSFVARSACTPIRPAVANMVDVSALVDSLGTWRIRSCAVNVSSRSDCALSLLNNVSAEEETFSVSLPENITITAIRPPSVVALGSEAGIAIDVFAPSASFATAVCTLETPSATVQRSSACRPLGPGINSVNVTFTPDALGEWKVASCRVESSASSSCLPSQLADTAGDGSFAVVPGNKLSIASISIPSSAIVDTVTGISALVANPTAGQLNAKVDCSLRAPTGTRTAESSCVPIAAGESAQLVASVLADVLGTWSVDVCNLRQGTDCSDVSAAESRDALGTFVVSEPVTPFITAVDADDFVVNASTANVRIDVTNPRNDDRFIFAECTYADPNGKASSSRTACIGAQRSRSVSLSTSLFADVVGTWSVSRCELFESTSFDCSGATISHNVSAPESFEVVKGFNLSFAKLEAPSAFNGSDVLLDIDVRNPSASDRFAAVSCEFRTPENAVIGNATQCKRAPSGTTGADVGVFADKLGTWSASCTLRSSLNSDCSSASVHDAESVAFNVTFPPDLEITRIELEEDDLAKEEPVEIDVSVRNPGRKRFGIATCRLLDPLNDTVILNSSCKEFPAGASRIFDIDAVLDVAGTWNITSCSINASPVSNCTDSRLHNTTNTTLIFNVTAKRLVIKAVRTPPALKIGDIAVIEVDAQNVDKAAHKAFVNCTVLNPLSQRIIFSSPEEELGVQQVLTFTPRRPVDVEGVWSVQACAVFRVLNSPAAVEDETVVNKDFVVSQQTECSATRPCPAGLVCQAGSCVAVPPAGECSFNSDCPGTDDKCFCSGGGCAACPSGFSCSDHQCVAVECTADAQCSSGTCRNGACVEEPREDGSAVNILIAAVLIILIPLILYLFAKRGMRNEEQF